MRGMHSLAVAVIATLVAASACSTGHSPAAKTHAEAVDQPVPVPVSTPSGPSAAQQAQKVIEAQHQIPPLQTAGTFCLAGIFTDLTDNARDAAISNALNDVDPTGGEALAWKLYNFEGDQVTVQKQLTSGQIFSGTFELGQLIYAILSEAGDLAGKYDPELAFQWKLFGLIGPAAVYCAEAAFWLDGTVGGQIGTYLRERFGSTPSQPAPSPTAVQSPLPASAGQCVFVLPNQVDCTSSLPEITLEGENDGDTSGCTFSGQISWGDGTQQTVHYQGANGIPSFVANHIYSQHGTFSITLTPSVVSGECSAFNGSYAFTYQ